jgi:hypothetical protein
MHSARAFAWCVLTLAVLWWPTKVPGPFDGAPLDGPFEAVIAGLLVPALCWFHYNFFRTRSARALIVALALVRLADAQMAQGGWCVRFDPPEQIVRDGTGRPHSWDVRADWRAPDPRCSAVMTTGWNVFKRFPVWFYNMPPTDQNPPDADDRPPYVTLEMSVLGFLDAKEPGSLDLQIGRYMTTAMFVDGRPAEKNGEFAYRIDVGPGLHLIQIENTLQANEWRFMPSWNQSALGTAGFPLITTERPGSRDRGWVRMLIGWSTTGLTAIFAIAWLVSALRAWGDLTTLVWAAAASAWLAYLAPRPGNEYVTSELARWSVTALAFAALLPVRDRLRPPSLLRGYGATSTLRLAFVVIGIPWLVFIGVGAFDHLAKFSFYAGGDDQWTFQRAAYRIYLQGYWLEGGEPTFWFQPGYRWIAGALHMLFGDSSLGEFHWDGICLLIMALFAHEIVARVAGFKWGLVAAATVLTLVMQGPPWIYWGVGLSEHAAAGFIYGASLTAMLATSWRLRLAAGVLAILGFFVRLNNLPLAFGIAVFAIPLDVRARDLWTPRQWLARVDLRTAGWVIGSAAIGMLLFSWRTWYYTGVFSFFQGTTLGTNAIWQPGMPMGELARRMADSAWMVLSMNDPPRFVWFATPMVTAAAISMAAVVGVPVVRNVPLALVLFFFAGLSGALVARGVAYTGRFSTIVIASACAVTISAVALLTSGLTVAVPQQPTPPREATELPT